MDDKELRPKFRTVGRTGIQTSHIGFGCGGIGNLFTMVGDADAQSVLEHAWDAGIRYYDTAPHYGRGRSEARLGTFLQSHDTSDAVISTKVGRVLTPGEPMETADGFIDPLPNFVHYDYSAEGIAASLKGTRNRLQRDYIDIVFVHDIGTLTHGTANPGHLLDLLNSGLPYLQELKKNGDIGAIGLGVNETAICLEILEHFDLDVILLAGRWTLLDRTGETALIPQCRERGTSIVLGGIFNSGILATGPVPGAMFNYAPASQCVLQKTEKLQSRAVALGMTLPEAALQYAMTRDIACSVLIGTGKVSSLERNLATIGKDIPEGAIEFFDADL